MAKRKIRKTIEAGKIYVPNPVELHRWCIEMAVRWPVHNETSFGHPMAGGMANYREGVHRDEDVIGRANKIHAWVTASR